jgi:hypothetical protein
VIIEGRCMPRANERMAARRVALAERPKTSKNDAEAKQLLQDLRRMSADLGVVVATAKSIALKLQDINKTSADFWKEYRK